MPLTDTAIRNAKPGDKAKKMFDAGGVYLEVAPSGGKWWRLKFRYCGKEKRLSFGVYPEVSLKLARERREEARKLLANPPNLIQRFFVYMLNLLPLWDRRNRNVNII